MDLSIDIKTTIQTAFILSVIGIGVTFLIGLNAIRSGMKLMYYQKRQKMIVNGWRFILASFGLMFFAFFLSRYAEPVAYRVISPSPTITITPSVTQTSTITSTQTVTVTPSITVTPAISNTPSIPEELLAQVTSVVTPNPEALFSPLQFSKQVDEDNQPINAAVSFEQPISSIFAAYSYDQMVEGAQWTALWYRGGDLLCAESSPWDGSTGGYAYIECKLSADQWLPGEYEVQFFMGETWKISGLFEVIGVPPTSTSTLPPTRTFTPSQTSLPTFTPSATWTASPTRTATYTSTSTNTPGPTNTPTRTNTPTITRTPRPTDTSWPTITPKGGG